MTCVNVAGNVAAIGAVPTQAASNDLDAPFVFLFRDSGPGGGTPVEPDGFALREIIDPNQCQNPIALVVAAGAPPIERGNILVHDAQA